MIDLKILGETARKARESAGYTQDVIAERAGVTRQTVYNFEQGNSESMKLLITYMELYPALLFKVKEKMSLNNHLNNHGTGVIEMLLFIMVVCGVVIFLCRG